MSTGQQKLKENLHQQEDQGERNYIAADNSVTSKHSPDALRCVSVKLYLCFFVFKMQKCSILLGVPMNHIFPVKNYHEEIDTDNDTDVLILRALTQIVNIANDKLVRSLSCDVRNSISGSKPSPVTKTTTTASVTI